MRYRDWLGIFMCVCCLFLTGCAASPIVGKWQTSVQGATVNIEFKADKTFTQAVTTPVGAINADGTYLVDKDQLTTTGKNFSAPGLPAPFISIAKRQLGKAQSGTVKFSDNNNTMILTTAAQTNITFTRQKDAK